MIDNSASMSATDEQESRLRTAKKQIDGLIDEMTSGDVAMIVSFADRPSVVQQFTDNRRLLKSRLQTVQQTPRTTSLAAGLSVAAGLANPGRSASDEQDTAVADALPATIYLFSDGKFSDVKDFSLGNLQPEYRPLGTTDAANVGITAFEVSRNEELGAEIQAFARLENYGPQDVEVTVELYLDHLDAEAGDSRQGDAEIAGEVENQGQARAANMPIDVTKLTLPAGKSGGVEFSRLPPMETGVLRLRIDNQDAMELDNQAWAVVNPPRRGRVIVVTSDNPALRMALTTEKAMKTADVEIAGPEILLDKDFLRRAADGYYDLIIYDRCVPKVSQDADKPLERMPAANTLFIGSVPPVDFWSSGEKTDLPQVIDTERTHPLMYLVELGDVLFTAGQEISGPPVSTTLIDTDRGHMFVIGPRGGYEDAVLGLDLFTELDGTLEPATNWPLRTSFPVFVLNLLQYMGGGQESVTSGSVQPGSGIALRSQRPVDVIQLRRPDGKVVDVRRGNQATFAFSDTGTLGVYEILEEGKLSYRFAVNLFDSSESNIATRPEIDIGYVKVEGKSYREAARAEIWRGLLWLVLLIALGEWYIYNRRVYV